jgi:hypothetical protein
MAHEGRSTYLSVVTVVKAEFGIGVDPDEFSFKGMKVPPGTFVFEHPPRTDYSRMWDGDKLAQMRNPSDTAAAEPPVITTLSANNSIVWWFAAVLFGTAFLVLYWRRKPRQRD